MGATIFGRKHNANCCCGGGCCAPRCEPLYIGDDLLEHPGECANPLPLTLACDLTATPSLPGYTCFNGSGSLTFKTPLSGGVNCWEGVISGSCTDCNSNTLNWAVKIVLCCDAADHRHTVSMVPEPDSICPSATLVSVDITTSACDPFLISGCFPAFGGCMVCFGDSPSFTVCFSIYEVP